MCWIDNPLSGRWQSPVSDALEAAGAQGREQSAGHWPALECVDATAGADIGVTGGFGWVSGFGLGHELSHQYGP